MISPKGSVNVAVLNCGYTCPSISKERGRYDEIFAALLRPALKRMCAKNATILKTDLEVQGFDTREQEYPVTLDGVDAIIISGSPNGAYEEIPWIQTLCQFVSFVYTEHPHIKLYGSCFGHQIICQALFREHGAVVERNPSGWGLGVHSIAISREFSSKFLDLLPSRSLRIQLLHGDHVRFVDHGLPDDVVLVGSTSLCHIQGLYRPGRLLTIQGHPEFDQFISTECLKLVATRAGWEAEFANAAIASAQADDDAAIAADIIMAFFLK